MAGELPRLESNSVALREYIADAGDEAQRRIYAAQVGLGTPQQRGARGMPDLAGAFARETMRTYNEAKTQLHYSATYWL